MVAFKRFFVMKHKKGFDCGCHSQAVIDKLKRQELYRYHPVLMSLGSQLGLSDQQIDALFVAAGKL